MKRLFAGVAIENVAYHFDILYTYEVAQDLQPYCSIGSRVMVNFGRGKNTRKQGVVFSLKHEQDDSKYKAILTVLDKAPFLSEEMIELAVFLKQRTFCTYFDAVKAVLPTGFYLDTNVSYIAHENQDSQKLTGIQKEVYEYLLSIGAYQDKKEILKALNLNQDTDVLEKLVRKNLVGKNYEINSRMGDKNVKTVKIILDDEKLEQTYQTLTKKQQSVLDVLKNTGSATVKELCYFTGVTSAVVLALEKKKIVEVFDADTYRIPKTISVDSGGSGEIELTNEQTQAFEDLVKKYNSGAGVSLLYGVTGSGKTSVFLRLIDEVIANDQQVIMMVPEISLTPQMMSIFKRRYKDQVAIFHSALSIGERRDEYKRVLEKQVKIAVGTRSAVFAPFDNLGLIVIDEEQEHTYKSESNPRYHTVDVAKFRAHKHGALVLLASATPSIQSYTMALNGKYSLHKISQRYGNAVLPEVEIVDMKNERQAGNKYNLSSCLLQALEQNLEQKKQSILLINRRGYNTFVVCDSCGEVVNCPACSISMTYHSANSRLMCHYCGYSKVFEKKCEHCGKDHVRASGYGTQRIEDEISMLLPQARVLRMDADSMSAKGQFEKNLIAFGNFEYDILLGTQMVSKGLNFENVTLVGVINADQQMNNDDFKSEEKTFDLLTQVVGRAGRGQYKGRAIIQTMTPENGVIMLSQQQDFEGFYKNEIQIRKIMTYPPYCDICSVMLISENEAKALSSARSFLDIFVKNLEAQYQDIKVIILGPMPPRISKVNNKFRYRIIIKCKNSARFRELMSKMLVHFGKTKEFSNVNVVVDINPESLA